MKDHREDGGGALAEITVKTPRGVRDLLPADAARKNQLEATMASFLSRWGYRPVVTPTFELLNAIEKADGHELDEKIYRFVDRDGNLLALRPELTTPIARLVATRLQDAPKPLRLYYSGSVFRYDEPQAGRQREFTQAGIELIGASGPGADAEVIAVAVGVMNELGLSRFRIDVGHVGFTAAVLESLQLPMKALRQVRRCILHQDYVGLKQVLTESGATAQQTDDVLRLIELRGDRAILDEAAELARTEQAQSALENLRAMYGWLENFGVAGWVRIDLGMVKHFDYYTGIVLEGYTAELGFSLCTGGRYDGLLGRFGYDVPATGLALGVERLLLALERNGVGEKAEPSVTLFVANEARMAEACSTAWRLRTQGHAIEIDVQGFDQEAALNYAAARGNQRVVFFHGEPGQPVEIVEAGNKRTVAVEDVLEGRGDRR